MNIAIIPARGGSRRIPRKNIRAFHGKPIIAYSIEAAKESGLFDLGVWVSTEDSEVAAVAYGSAARTVVRPLALAQDEIGTQQVTTDALRTASPLCEYACCIYATAPLMTAADLRNGLQALKRYTCGFVYVPGWYYWGRTESFINGRSFDGAMNLTPTSRWIDINTEADWTRAEQLYASIHGIKA